MANKAYNAMQDSTMHPADEMIQGELKKSDMEMLKRKGLPVSPSGEAEWSPDEIHSLRESIYDAASSSMSEVWNDPKKIKNLMSIMESGTYATDASGSAGSRSIWEKSESGKDVMKWSIKDAKDPSGRKGIEIPKSFRTALGQQLDYLENPELDRTESGVANWPFGEFPTNNPSYASGDYKQGAYWKSLGHPPAGGKR